MRARRSVVAKDRAAPFSRKHMRYWLPVTGGMILIGALCLALGFCTYDPPAGEPQKIELVLPPPTSYGIDAAAPAGAADATAR
jgi:hypothetical protein